MKKKFIFLMILGIVNFVNAQTVNIPDANFKALLVRSSINTNGDSEIQVSEAMTFTGTLNCSYLSINNLTGIEAFVNLKELNCSGNKLTTLDVSKNTALQYLYCNSNQLTTLDVSKNIDLTNLQVGTNKLTNLDVSKNILLEELHCYNNQLTTLDVRKNIALKDLLPYKNQLTTLDVSENTALQILFAYSNQLATLDVSKNTALRLLFVYNNLLTTLDVSKNTMLESLYAHHNQLTTLDFSENTLMYLYVNSNQLTSLNIKNGQNKVLHYMYASDNPNLSCIQVDNADDANFNTTYGGWQKDAIASYNTNCTLSVKNINRKEIALYPNPVKDIFNFSEEVSKITISDLSGKILKQISSSEKSINISNLAKGIYIISATTKTGEAINKKFIKD